VDSHEFCRSRDVEVQVETCTRIEDAVQTALAEMSVNERLNLTHRLVLDNPRPVVLAAQGRRSCARSPARRSRQRLRDRVGWFIRPTSLGSAPREGAAWRGPSVRRLKASTAR